MSVFRLQDSKNNSLQDGKGWFLSNPYSSSNIEAITDPDGGKGSDPTSIPTPFARMDLVRTAYKFLNSQGVDGNTSFHKIVSHALDIGEIFFNYNSFGESLKLFEWDKETHINELIRSSDDNQLNYGKTLQMYIRQDSNNFNFSKMSKVYIVLYNNIPIGGTSPVSLFFSTPNLLDSLDIRLPKGNIAFKNLCTLYERDESFIRFMFSLRKSGQGFDALFPELGDYMHNCLKHIQQTNLSLFNELNQIPTTTYTNTYKTISQGVFVLNNLPLKQCDRENEKWEKDYAIQSEKFKGESKPLVLKNGHTGVNPEGNSMNYYKGPFNPNIEIPTEVDIPIDERMLPGFSGVKYPYITIGDFLEPYIIKTVFPIDSDSFFDGGYKHPNSSAPVSYLLPVKTTFFMYFDVEDLENRLVYGEKMLRIEHRAGSAVKVTLRVPVAKGYIEYERTYKGVQNQLSGQGLNFGNNEGIISEHRFDLAIFPFVKIDSILTNPDYRICFVDGDQATSTVNNKFSLEFYHLENINKKIPVNHYKERNKKSRTFPGITNFAIIDNFDCIKISINKSTINGLLLPKFKQITQSSDKYTFAIDFGTTYTHVEYSINDQVSQPLNIEKTDMQCVKLHSPSFDNLEAVFPEIENELQNIFDTDFLPSEINAKTNYNFPLRTSLLELDGLNINEASSPLIERTIPFFYEKKTEIPNRTNVITDIKWSVERNYSVRLNEYLANLLLIIRNKVLVNSGNITSTKIIWFFPASMSSARKLLFERLWIDLFEKYFVKDTPNKPIPISESLAPYYWYHNNEGAISFGDNTVVSVDIGGETADIAVFKDNKPELITSFRFGADSLFDNGYMDSNAANNGFFKFFGDEIIQTLQANNQGRYVNLINTISNNSSSKDIISLFFSLENNRDLIKKNVKILFSEMISNSDSHRIVFVIYYASIIYHIAKLLKACGLDMARYITFSGTGSKVFNIITPTTSNRAFSDIIDNYTKLIFEKVYGQPLNSKITVLRRNDIPKEITAKGGFYSKNFDGKSKEIKKVLVGLHDDVLVDGDTTYQTINNDKTIKSVVTEIEAFIKLFFDIHLNKEFDYEENFLIKSALLRTYQKLLSEDLFNYVKKGLELKLPELASDDEVLDETLFFYGLKGSIPNLVNWIAEE